MTPAKVPFTYTKSGTEYVKKISLKESTVVDKIILNFTNTAEFDVWYSDGSSFTMVRSVQLILMFNPLLHRLFLDHDIFSQF